MKENEVIMNQECALYHYHQSSLVNNQVVATQKKEENQ